MSLNKSILAASLSIVFSISSLAAVSADEAKQLGGAVLTEWGAERAGNKEGSIPAYTAERIKVPASYDPKDPGQLPDPFGDKPLFTITAQNMDKYGDKLTEGQKAMFRIYPNYRMDIYQTHRTAHYPKYVIDNTLKNSVFCKGGNGELRLEGCFGGVPFPIPKTGNQVVWNHLVQYQSPGMGGKIQSWVVAADGKQILQGVIDAHYHFPYWDPKRDTPAESSSDYWKLRFDYLAPARVVGNKYVILSPLDPINPGQRAWVYIPGQRRVKLAPDLAYDTPGPASGGAATMDELSVFLGAQDRYNMKLVGKKEVYLVYNSNRMTDYKTCPPELAFTKNFINPDCVRWELHRAWVVEATLKPGYRHILPRRTMYFDEDVPGAGIGDSYDASGKLYRVDYVPHVLYYAAEIPTQLIQTQFTYDLQTGVVADSSYFGFKGGGFLLEAPKAGGYFTPEAVAAEGIR